jgi:hypothetical protein
MNKLHFNYRLFKWGLRIEFFRFRNIKRTKWDCLFFLSLGYSQNLNRLNGYHLYFWFDTLRFNVPEMAKIRIGFSIPINI